MRRYLSLIVIFYTLSAVLAVVSMVFLAGCQATPASCVIETSTSGLSVLNCRTVPGTASSLPASVAGRGDFPKPAP